ncbi:MAG TPA: hypothetical protein PLG66_20395, partial [Calditrichia bacterium]|nr:hypothetical protein [Calditrichia bacterium]
EKLPELVLVACEGQNLPEDAHCGQVVGRVFGDPLPRGKKLRYHFNISHLKKPSRLRLFAVQKSADQTVRLLPRFSAQLKL